MLFDAQGYYQASKYHTLYNRILSTWPFQLHFAGILWTINCLEETRLRTFGLIVQFNNKTILSLYYVQDE